MFKDKLKKLFKWNKHDENTDNELMEDTKLVTVSDKSKRKIENIVVFIVILIITIIAINMIWNENNKTHSEEEKGETKILAKDETTIETSKESLEYRLENILKQIKGVGEVKVLITYSQTSETLAMYNEDNSQSDTEETDSGGGSRKITENNTKKEVIYKEVDGEKIPVTQSIVKPKAEGAIITAVGASDANVKANIIQAVEAVTGLATHKIQVFEMSE